jgi:c-di-GMP-binding flagellar brake protein YcgR
MLVFDGMAALAARTVDIAANGMAVTLGQMVKAGLKGNITFEMLVDGKVSLITARVSVGYCIFSGDEFKVGLLFAGLDPATTAAVTRFLR